MNVVTVTGQLQYIKRAWDGECVVYVLNSRETLHLSEPYAVALDLLELGAIPYGIFCDKLRSVLSDTTHSSDAISPGLIVDTLCSAGLVEILEEVS